MLMSGFGREFKIFGSNRFWITPNRSECVKTKVPLFCLYFIPFSLHTKHDDGYLLSFLFFVLKNTRKESPTLVSLYSSTKVISPSPFTFSPPTKRTLKQMCKILDSSLSWMVALVHVIYSLSLGHNELLHCISLQMVAPFIL